MSSLNYHRKLTESGVKNYRPINMSRVLRRFFIFNFMLLVSATLLISAAKAAEIIGPQIRVHDRDIYITASLALDERNLQELRNGITKELRFHLSIYRVWKMWPDEFIYGRSFVRILTCDPVKTEYTATSNDGNTLVEKRFKSFDSMIKWALSFEDFKLTSIRDLDPGVYFVRVTAESRIRKLPPVLGYFMVFLPENEFKVRSDSAFITVGSGK